MKPRTKEANQPTPHTPGPWKVSDKSRRKIVGPDGETIASVGRVEKVSDEVWQTYLANAQLIAASPTMAAALLDIVEQLVHYVNSDDGEIPDCSECEAALQLAGIQAHSPSPKSTKPKYYECGCCGGMHHIDRPGTIDCRDDATRFTLDQLDTKHGVDGWEEVDDPLTEHWEAIKPKGQHEQ